MVYKIWLSKLSITVNKLNQDSSFKLKLLGLLNFNINFNILTLLNIYI